MAGGLGAPGAVAVGAGDRRRRLRGARAGDPAVLATAAAVLGQVRKAKTEAKLSMRAEAARVVVRGPDGRAPCAPASPTCGRRATSPTSRSTRAGAAATEVTLAEPVAS